MARKYRRSILSPTYKVFASMTEDGEERVLVRNLTEAKARVFKFYWSVDCKNGHTGPRYVTTGNCVECLKARVTLNRLKKQNKEK